MEELVYNLDNDEKEYIIVDEDTKAQRIELTC